MALGIFYRPGDTLPAERLARGHLTKLTCSPLMVKRSGSIESGTTFPWEGFRCFPFSWTKAVKETNKSFFQIMTLNLQMVDNAFSTNVTQCNVVAKTSFAIQKKISGAKNVQATHISTDLLCDCVLN